MKLNFVRPLIPNYIKTLEGLILLGNLSKEEVTEYSELWDKELRLSYERKKSAKGE